MYQQHIYVFTKIYGFEIEDLMILIKIEKRFKRLHVIHIQLFIYLDRIKSETFEP